ncbi:MAG TPA: site-specific integrase [Candidatus Paceibacterota bacterium]|nr:site-specific integrase [Candidatus Paceibacterota bacterium]
MTKTSYKNEQLKREFFEHLRGAEGFAPASVSKFAEAISQWQTFTDNEDFGSFNKTTATSFRDWLKTRETKTVAGKLTLVSQYNYLRRLKRFFTWLSGQPDYRNKVLKNEIEFLRLSKGDARIARAGTTRATPSFDDAKKIIEGIEIKNEIDRRDRAMISFALTTGCRIFAIISLRMKNFDKEKRLIHQNPGDGVHTKNSKTILTTFFPIGWDDPERFFVEWYEYLERKGYGPNDPIFPATLHDAGSVRYSKDDVGKAFWNGTDAARKIFEKRCHDAGVRYFHPHSFRHLIVSMMSKTRLTEEEKRAISLNLGHENIATTFGSYGYGGMSEEDAVRIVQKLKDYQANEGSGYPLTDAERAILERLLARR